MSFSKSWNCTRRSGSCNFSFLKNSLVWLLITNTNMKKIEWKKCRKMFLKPFFVHSRKLSVQKFCHCFTWDHWPTKFLIVRISANHNPKLRCVICTGVTRFAPVVTRFAPVIHFLHWCYTWTALLSANQNRVIFSCVLLGLIIGPL